MPQFTPKSLPDAIEALFKLNHHVVDGPVKIAGAEIDLVATPIGNPFAPKVYIEATIEYVDNTKYGKDLTKLALVREQDPSATCLIVSAEGFTLDVMERAKRTRIETLTYSQLFAQFEKFQPYVDLHLGNSKQADQLRDLAAVYERPKLVDAHGQDDALDWMETWLSSTDSRRSWLLVVGEYGTGKSALTRILQKRWLEEYSQDAQAPIPVRIELGAFTKQFDAQGLLHHFLDRNGLGHVPIDFFWSLIRSGRVVLLLDGYDEMAQYLSQRERRTTLQALAELSADGVKGMLTSRPNYFSETEQLAIFDHLYKQITLRSRLVDDDAQLIAEREVRVDDLIQRSILDRFERSLRDLSPSQAKTLVKKLLSTNNDAAEAVIGVLERVFRTSDEGTEVALSGKPVIISYLIDVASSLQDTSTEKLTEWDVYGLIVDKLALRDLEQTTRVGTDERRLFLQSMALQLAKGGLAQIDEEQFRVLIERVFKTQLRRFAGASRAAEVDSLFEDLRRSGTLTRGDGATTTGWKFSHNSLREFLVAELMVEDVLHDRPLRADPPISDAMRTFAASTPHHTTAFVKALAKAWQNAHNHPGLGSYLTLLWDAIPGPHSKIESIAGTPVRAQNLHLASLKFSDRVSPLALRAAAFRDCTILDVSFEAADLTGTDFAGSLLEAVNFDDAILREANFSNAVLIDVSLIGASLEGAVFQNLNTDVAIVVESQSGRVRLEGAFAIGHLQYLGATVDNIDPYFVWSNHPKFPIVTKVASKLVEGGTRQRRGLEQRGAAAQDPTFAKKLVRRLETLGYVKTPLGRPELLEITPVGRSQLTLLQAGLGLPVELVDFLKEN